jgi:hypothetical protein
MASSIAIRLNPTRARAKAVSNEWFQPANEWSEVGDSAEIVNGCLFSVHLRDEFDRSLNSGLLAKSLGQQCQPS